VASPPVPPLVALHGSYEVVGPCGRRKIGRYIPVEVALALERKAKTVRRKKAAARQHGWCARGAAVAQFAADAVGRQLGFGGKCLLGVAEQVVDDAAATEAAAQAVHG
jgi:hypothetical protein